MLNMTLFFKKETNSEICANHTVLLKVLFNDHINDHGKLACILCFHVNIPVVMAWLAEMQAMVTV